jgi:hypothetical protein
MSVRFYLHSTGQPPRSPAFAAWTTTAAAVRRRMARAVREGTALTSFVATKTAATNPSDVLVAQFVSEPLQAQTISSAGFVKGIIRALESAVAADARAQMTIRVLSSDGATVRGTLLALNAGALSNEFDAATRTNRRFPLNWSGSGAALTQVVTLEGDVIVVEVGARFHTASTGDTCTLVLGDASGTDLAEDETSTVDDTPWVEFSQDLLFLDVSDRRGAQEDNLTQLGVHAQPVGAGESYVARGLQLDESTAQQVTARRSRGSDYTSRLGLALGLPVARGESYSAPGLADFQHSTTDFQSRRRPVEPVLPVASTKNLTPPVVSNIVPAAASTIARDDTVAFRVTDDLGAFRRIVVAAVFSSGRTEVAHDGSSFASAYADLSTRTATPGGHDYVLSRVDTSSPYGDAPGWLTAGLTLRIFAIDEDGNEAGTTSLAYTVSNPPPAPTISAFTPASGSSILRTTSVSFDAEDESGLNFVEVTAEHSSGLVEVVWDGGAFKAPYTGSTQTPIGTAGFGFTVVRGGLGWPAVGLTLRVRAIDGDGNISQSTATYVVTNPWDAAPPLVSNVSPPTGTPIARSAPVFFDVTDDSGLFRRIIVTASFEDGAVDVVHDGDGFAARYNQGSTRGLVTNGYHYRVQRSGGWPFAPTIRAYAIDQSGNENT